MVVMETIVHQPQDEQPEAVERRFSRPVKGEEQMYLRRMPVDGNWRKLDLGWIASAAMLHLENLTERRDVIPTEQEKRDAADRIVEVGVCLGDASQDMCEFALVRPGETMRFEPLNVGSLRVRCRRGATKVMLTLVPE